MDFHEALNWRYATKKMNGEQVPQEKVDKILNAIRLAPTSMGAQPFSVFLITDQEIKQQILPIASNQTQVKDSSHLLIFAAWETMTDDQIQEYVDQTAEERELDKSELDPMKKGLKNLASKSKDEFFSWSARQAYIAFGFGLAAAAVEKVDATPMEGFDNEALDKLLGLREQGMRSVTMMPLGYRDEENDWLAPMKRVRRPSEKLFIKNEVPELT